MTTGPARTTLRYWAAARAAAGTPADELTAPTLADALAQAVALHGSGLEKVLSVCSYVVDGDPVGGRPHEAVPLRDGSLVDVLPPFAGG
ncbi:MAG TPA: MoaD/ThiS family protein [Mycobacteriales bacterium]|jgi:molybdopterin converting factor small subunit|nr:MoaD/ThiS family protein [Mycobacteriales bacterium]